MGIESAKAADFDEDLRRMIHVTFRSDYSDVFYCDDENSVVDHAASSDPRDLGACGCPIEYVGRHGDAAYGEAHVSTQCYNNLFRLLVMLGVHKDERYIDFFRQYSCGAW
jgi:hypothetical protein